VNISKKLFVQQFYEHTNDDGQPLPESILLAPTWKNNFFIILMAWQKNVDGWLIFTHTTPEGEFHIQVL